MSPLGKSSPRAPEDSDAAACPIGIARLSKRAFDGEDLKPLWRGLMDRYVVGDDDAATLMDLATLEQLFGDVESGLVCQRAALDRQKLYRTPAAAEPAALRLLALAAAGDIGANTPLEFLLEGSDVALDTLYVVPGCTLPAKLPPFDLAIVAVGESDANRPVLAEIARITSSWLEPVLNDPAAHRRAVARKRGGDDAGRSRPARPADAARSPRARAGARNPRLPTHHAARRFPCRARPRAARRPRRARRPISPSARRAIRSIIAPFIDYRSADGLFRKYRIAFIDGAPYACHMAICRPVDDLLPQRRHARERGEARRGSALHGGFRRRFRAPARGGARRHRRAHRARLFRHRLRRAAGRQAAPVRGRHRDDRPRDGSAGDLPLQGRRRCARCSTPSAPCCSAGPRISS